MRRKLVHFLWGFLTVSIVTGTLFFVSVWNGWIGYMPDMEALQNPIDKYASMVYSADGKLMGTWNLSRNSRVAVNYNALSPHLVHALVATEDSRFYEHSGIDFIALGRAIVKRGILGQHSAGGGSTITQQLAKQLYSDKTHSVLERLLQKPIEWTIAVKLERNFTKEEIIAMYLNYFDFLHGAVGIKSAAKVYFNKEPKDLTLSESAMLIGMCKNPSYFNPVRHPDRALERRNVVYQQMEKAGYLTHGQYLADCEEPIQLDFHRIDPNEGTANYFRTFLAQYMMAKKPSPSDYPSWNKGQYHIDSLAWAQDPLYGWCNKNFRSDGEPYNVYTDGLRVYTTIDSRMQHYAEIAVRRHLAGFLQPAFDNSMAEKPMAPYSSNLSPQQVKDILNRTVRQSDRYRSMRAAGASTEEIRKAFRTPVEMTVFSYRGDIDTVMTPLDSVRYYKRFLRAGFACMDPLTGQMKAYVGGIDYNHFKYDMVMGGRRQVGSTIKPFLYSLAMENGYTPCSTAPNVQRRYGNWMPRNSSHARYGQNVTLKWGLMMSNNWISAYLINRLGVSPFINILHQFGLNNPDIDNNATPVLCLGPCEVSVGEMVSGYTAFANHGIRCSPMFVTKIEDSHGNVLAQFQPSMNEVISKESAYKMIEMLRAVVDEGTAGRLRWKFGIEGEVGGKTGTTNNNSDGWFLGFTPQLVAGVWVGGEDRDIHFDSMSFGQGATMALPIWAYFMKMVYADPTLGYRTDAKFSVPDDFNSCAQGDNELGGESIDDVYE